MNDRIGNLILPLLRIVFIIFLPSHTQVKFLDQTASFTKPSRAHQYLYSQAFIPQENSKYFKSSLLIHIPKANPEISALLKLSNSLILWDLNTTEFKFILSEFTGISTNLCVKIITFNYSLKRPSLPEARNSISWASIFLISNRKAKLLSSSFPLVPFPLHPVPISQLPRIAYSCNSPMPRYQWKRCQARHILF